QGPTDIDSWVDGSIGLGRKSTAHADEPRHSMACTRVACAFDGRIDNRDELIDALAANWPVAPDTPDHMLVRTAYLESGESCVGRLKGDFAFALFDRQARQLLLARDRLGVRPLCYTRLKGAFLFASEAKALLAAPGVHAEPDELMLAHFVLQ